MHDIFWPKIVAVKVNTMLKQVKSSLLRYPMLELALHLFLSDEEVGLFISLCLESLVIAVFGIRGHSLSTYAKFSEKLTFLTPWYAHVRVRIRGLKMLIAQKILRTYLMDDPLVYHKISLKSSNFIVKALVFVAVDDWDDKFRFPWDTNLTMTLYHHSIWLCKLQNLEFCFIFANCSH